MNVVQGSQTVFGQKLTRNARHSTSIFSSSDSLKFLGFKFGLHLRHMSTVLRMTGTVVVPAATAGWLVTWLNNEKPRTR